MTIEAVEGAIRAVLGLGNTVLAQNAGWTKNKTHDTAVFSYRRDFDSLWDLGKGTPGLETIARRLLKKRKDKTFTLVIIWDGEPAGKTGAVNTSRYITPLDWAVALSLAIHQLSPDNYPALRIIIVDPASHRADYADCLGLLPHLRLALPWITMCQPAVRAPGSMGIDRLFVDLIDVGGKLPGGVPIMSDAAKSSHTDPELIRRIWSSFLAKPSTHDDHHAISNLLGPQLLLGETARTTDPAVQALRCVMLTAGLLPSTSSGKEALLTEKACWLKPEDHPVWKTIKKYAGEKLKLILVDDQWQDGWGEVLCKTVGVAFDASASSANGALVKISQSPGNISIYATSSADAILEKLENSCKDSRFALRLDDSEPDAAEILFLDLRLFSGSLASGEVAFVERCLNLARKIVVDWGDRLPWPGFSEDELGRIETWITKAKEPGNGDSRAMPGYAEALTLFARIIAQIDLSLPIVLFTSTGRRDIMKAFDGYGSIICEFEKPRLPGSIADDLAVRAKEQFNSAVTRALELLDARLVSQRFFAFPFLNRPSSHATSPDAHWTIELYVDESGSEIDKATGLPKKGEKLTVGGLLVIFAPGADPDRFDGALLRYMKELVPFIGTSESIKQNIRYKAEDLSAWVLNGADANRPKHVSLITLSGIMPDPKAGDDGRGYLELNHVGDNLHRDLMAHVIDFAIYHHSLRVVPSSDEISCRIHLPTRILPPVDSSYSENLFNTLGISSVYVGDGRELYEARDTLDRLGTVSKIVAALNDAIKSSPVPPKRIRYFNFDDARPLVQSVINHYKYAFFSPRMDHARAYMLSNPRRTGVPGGPKALHLLMDAVLSAKCPGPVIEQITGNGAAGEMDHSMMAMTHAARMYAVGYFAEALTAVTDISVEPAAEGVTGILGGEIRDAAGRINGIEYMSFIDTRAERMGFGKSANITRNSLKGRVLRKGKLFDEISDGTSGVCKYYHGDDTKSLGLGDKVVYVAARGFIPGERNVVNILNHASHPVWNLIKAQRVFVGRVRDLKDWQNVEVELCGLHVRGNVRMRDSCCLGDLIYFKATSGDGLTYTGEQVTFANPADLNGEKVVSFGKVTKVNKDGGLALLSSSRMRGMIHHSKIPGASYGMIDAHLTKDDKIIVEVLDATEGLEKLELKLLKNLTRWYAE